MVNPDQGNSKLGNPITHTQAIPASMEDVWEIISRPGILTEYHPFCQKNIVEKWPGIGSKDKILYFSGLQLEREFIAWREGSGYDLIASSEEGLRYEVSWRLTGSGDDQSQLTLTITPYSRERMEQYSRLLGKYLEQLMKGLEFFVRTGTPVMRNQFGSHRLFSPPEAAGSL
jgi:hypothetical protein